MSKNADQQSDSTMERDPRRQIISVAAELFMDFGYSATSIDAIAERIGATKGMVYYHYRSKSQIFFDIQRLAMERLSMMVEPVARSDLPTEDKLRAMAHAHVKLLLTETPIHKVAVQGLERYLFEQKGFRHTKVLAEINRSRDNYEEMFAEVIAQGARERIFKDLSPRLLTKPFFGAMNWVTVWYRPRRLQTDADTVALQEILVDFAMSGLRNDGRPIDARFAQGTL
ncbi:TetR/AcrR family transcriptional regulator [Paracoccus sediminicola]|uniref:TetR/AcrR family transcriptional regulator n=1 Tax=Paracoccus sediminicola TaxID=3017783 RepID=UPI0022F0594D|nr:TetR/AcrR family transcriptional regulator [Paracoccus sediminicola]WBU56212.1 TetR/AcrR family transcriptional regulator [Paracoccus sediminicola]